ncbi:MAG: exodeoxyribonuclease VII small subunit [Verrucomicrobiaceae bacterium]|nr:MAG: exodeoxyribonuclease VII small subunit [Verrucomicrobiaceae bacterium]
MPARRKSADEGQNGNDLSFETALAELEEIVAVMEEEQLPLEELVSRYEKGSKLLARCETVLASARKRLQTISARAEAGNGAADSAEDDELPGAPAEHDDDDDIRLF